MLSSATTAAVGCIVCAVPGSPSTSTATSWIACDTLLKEMVTLGCHEGHPSGLTGANRVPQGASYGVGAIMVPWWCHDGAKRVPLDGTLWQIVITGNN